jgi:tetratricopeptide (TPR) repeat protein
LRHWGDARQSQGRLDEALGLYEKALKINRSVGDNTGVAVTLNQLAIVYETRGDLSQAGKLYRESYTLFLKVGHRLNAAILANNVAGILLQEGKLAQAEQISEKSMNLARAIGSKTTAAQAQKLLADLALLRGDLEQARAHIESAQVLEPQGENVNRYEYLMRMSRILAAQDDLASARRNRAEGLALAEKIGAEGLAAQSRLAVAELDLDEGRPLAAEQPIRHALAVFRSEKMRDDEVQAQATLSRCLLMQAKTTDAKAALSQGRMVVAYSQNPAVHVTFAIADARVKAAGAGASRLLARTDLLRSIKQAGSLGFIPLQFEAQLALDEIEMSDDATTGRKCLQSLEKRAHEYGLERIARRAAELRTDQRKTP